MSQWRYVNTANNPADFALRSVIVGTFLKTNMWTSGPKFMKQSENERPEVPSQSTNVSLDDPEI